MESTMFVHAGLFRAIVSHVVLFAGAMALVGCASSSSGVGLKVVQDRGRAASNDSTTGQDLGRCEYKNRSDREASEVSGPGAMLPNLRRVYQYYGTGEDRKRILVCREVDTNLDGLKDVVRTFNEKGQTDVEEVDSDNDGKFDTWTKYSNGRIIEVRRDTNRDGRYDEFKYYAGGNLQRVTRDTNSDGKPDVWEFYVQGSLERMGRDIDFDGKVDRWDHDELRRRAADAADKAQERSEGGAKAGEGPKGKGGASSGDGVATQSQDLNANGGGDAADPKADAKKDDKKDKKKDDKKDKKKDKKAP